MILEQEDKPRTSEDVDRIVSAEIPDPNLYPHAYATVTRCMNHGHCGRLNPSSPCMAEGVCTKKYPKAFNDVTTTENDGYPIYRRRDNGNSFVNGKGEQCDNRHIIPYNMTLATIFDCHINVEICSSIRAIKYIYKYIFKGSILIE